MPPESSPIAVAEPADLKARADDRTGGRPSVESSSHFILHGVPWDLYCSLRDLPRNYHTKMTYCDGALILMSPQHIHEYSKDQFALVVRMVAAALRIGVAGSASTTLRKQGDGEDKGSGKEPDTSFYFGEHVRIVRGKESIVLPEDPPPDLAVEIDNKADSGYSLPIYADLGVPELWRYDAREGTLRFGRLSDGVYEAIDRSLCLPRLTPALVLEALAALEEGEDELYESAWLLWLLDWARQLPEPPAPG